MISAEDHDVDLVDQDLTPLMPPAEMTPAAPLVSAIGGRGDDLPSATGPLTPWPSAIAAEMDVPAVRVAPPVPSSGKPMPASEQMISVAPHRPPSARSDQGSILPSVIVDVASEYVALVDRVLGLADTPRGGVAEGASSADEAEAELVRAGGYAMPAIMARFPGPVTIERDRLADGPLPRVAECGPILRVIASQRRTALPFVLSHVEDPSVEKRFWATYLLTELVYPDVLEPLLQRVFDEEPRVRRAARAAARAYAEVHPAAIVERLELIAMDGGERRELRTLAIDALGETREPLAVPALIPLLDDPDQGVVSAVRGALTMIARQDFGTASAKWGAWWEQNRERHRLEWLIDALMQEQAALRAAAGEELKTITKEYFGYYDDLPKRERERAQSRYREWWNSVGRVRFSRASSSRG
jgi:HEAT repeat protein